jgi:hypothetical protein
MFCQELSDGERGVRRSSVVVWWRRRITAIQISGRFLLKAPTEISEFPDNEQFFEDRRNDQHFLKFECNSLAFLMRGDAEL